MVPYLTAVLYVLNESIYVKLLKQRWDDKGELLLWVVHSHKDYKKMEIY